MEQVKSRSSVSSLVIQKREPMENDDDYSIDLDLTPQLKKTPAPFFKPQAQTPAPRPVFTPQPGPKTPAPVFTPPAPAFTNQPTQNSSARVERILSQWINVDMLKVPTGPVPEAAHVIRACLIMLKHGVPSRDAVPPDDALLQEINRYAHQDLERINRRTLLENIIALAPLVQLHSRSAVQFCQELAALHGAKPGSGGHASMLFSVIHGRLLNHLYSLPTAPDSPGGQTAQTNDKVFYQLIQNLLFPKGEGGEADPIFASLIPEDYENITPESDTWLTQVNTIGGLGLACQLFVQLPHPLMGFWFFLSDNFFGTEAGGIDPDFADRVQVDVDPQELIEGYDEEGDLLVPEPMDDDGGRSDEILAQQKSIMAKRFFSPPYAHVHTLGQYVLQRLEAIRLVPEIYVQVMDRLKARIRLDLGLERQWKLLEDLLQRDYLKPGVRVSELYVRLKGVLSAHETASRLSVLFRDDKQEGQLGPLQSRWVYGQLRRLMDYAPEVKALKQQLGQMTYLLSNGRLGSSAAEQEHIQEDVMRSGARWAWPPPTPELNRAVVAILGRAQGWTPEALVMAGADVPQQTREKEEDEAGMGEDEGEGARETNEPDLMQVDTREDDEMDFNE